MMFRSGGFVMRRMLLLGMLLVLVWGRSCCVHRPGVDWTRLVRLRLLVTRWRISVTLLRRWLSISGAGGIRSLLIRSWPLLIRALLVWSLLVGSRLPVRLLLSVRSLRRILLLIRHLARGKEERKEDQSPAGKEWGEERAVQAAWFLGGLAWRRTRRWR